MGSFYRSQHEFIFAFKNGSKPHVNAFELGQHGRYRTNVWHYKGVNSFKAGRKEELQLHPTMKPVQMIADALKDVSCRGDIVLDVFGGSGSTLIAAHKTGRRAFVCEIDPIYCDRIVARWEVMKDNAGADAFRHPGTGGGMSHEHRKRRTRTIRVTATTSALDDRQESIASKKECLETRKGVRGARRTS